MDPGHRMSVHVRVCDVDQHALFLAAGSVYLLTSAPESGYSLGLEPDVAANVSPDVFLRFGGDTRILGWSMFCLNGGQGLDLSNFTGKSQ